MPIHQDLLDVLVCPVSKKTLSILQKQTMAELNVLISQGKITTVGGQKVEMPLEEGLITEDGKTIYRIDDGIPIMLAEEGIPAAQLEA
jgi:uncharacterized protein YbaR (Trm112 family)